MQPPTGHVLFGQIHGISAHSLEAAHIAAGNDLARHHGRALGHSGLDAGHVVQGRSSHGLGHGHGTQGGAAAERQPRPLGVGRIPLAGPAHRAEGGGMGLAAHGATRDVALVAAAEVVGLYLDVLSGQDGDARLVNFLLQLVGILLPLGRGLQEPGLDGRIRVKLVHVQTHAHPPAVALVVQAHGVQPQVENAQPAVARRAGRKQLDGVGQTVGGFADGVVQHAVGHVAAGQFHHIPADDQAGSGIAVEFAGFLHEFFVRIGTDAHGAFLKNKRGEKTARSEDGGSPK